MRPQKIIRIIRRILVLVLLMGVFCTFSELQNIYAATGIYRTINFQGKIVNKTDGTNISTNSYSFIFKLYDAATGGNQLPVGSPWSETQSLPVTDGIFQATLGSSTAFPSTLDFNSDSIYLDITFNGETFGSRVRLTAVPYAFNAEKVGGLTVTNTTGTLTIPNGTTIEFSGANNLTLTTTGITNATLPSGTITLVDLATSQSLTNKTIGSTGLTFSGADTDITTVSNEHFSIVPNGSGNVGIGTTVPIAKLDVLGDSNFQGYATVSASLSVGSYGSVPGGFGNAVFSGNVGIGTSSPTNRLEVILNQDAAVFRNLNTIASPVGQTMLSFKYLNGTNLGTVYGNYVNSTATLGITSVSDGQLALSANSQRQTPHILINAAGNVGIGSTVPTALLDIGGTATAAGNITMGGQLQVGRFGGDPSALGNGSMIYNTATNKFRCYQDGAWTDCIDTGSPGGLDTYVQFNDGGSTFGGDAGFTYNKTTDRLNITNLAVNTASPLEAFDVTGNATVSGNLTIGNASLIRPAYGPLSFAYKSGLDAWTTGMILQDTTGYIGIGTTGPSQLLDVLGHGIFGNQQSINGSNGVNTLMLNERTTDVSQNIMNIQGTLEVAAGSETSQYYYGGFFNANTIANSTNYTGRLVGLQGQADHNGTGTVNEARGLAGFILNASGGTITSAYGGKFGIVNYSTGNVGSAYGAYINALSNASGTVDNNYGLYIENQSAGTNNYSIYSNGGLVYLSGNTGVGTTAPTAKLDVSGTASVSALTIRGSSPGYIDQVNGNDLIFRTSVGGEAGLAERLTLTNSGNIGIGTTGPEQQLDVAGSATVSGNVAMGGQLQVGRFGADPSALGNGSMIYNTATNKFRCYQNGAWTDCIGGGTGSSVWSDLTAPSSALNLNMYQSVGTSYATTFTYGNATGTTNLFNITDTLSNTGTGYLVNFTTASSSTLKPFHVSAAGVEAILVDAAGNVGIGTTTPSSFKLQVNGNLGPNTADTYDLGSSASEWNSLYLADGTGLLAGGGLFFGTNSNFLLTYDATTSLALELSDGTNTFLQISDQGTTANFAFNTDDLYISSTGNVGIGTTSPSAPLSVAGASSTITTTSGDLTIVPADNLIITADAVGINTTGPTEALHVVGNARVTAVGSATMANDLRITSDGTFTTSTSDISMKTNIETLESDTLSKLLELNPVSFNWIDSPDGTKDIGFIAQEINAIFPSVTFINPTDGKMGVNYSRLPSILTKAIQEQQGQINRQQAIIERLEGLFNDFINSQAITSTSGALLDADASATDSSALDGSNLLSSLNTHIIASSSGLTLSGKTTVYDLNVINAFKTGLLTIETDETASGSIQTAVVPLKLQKDSTGNLEIMGSKVVIDTEGNMTVKERVTAKEVQMKKLTILEETDATSGAVLGSYAGQVELEKDKTSVTVKTSQMSPRSLIFTTPVDFPAAVSAKKVDDTTIEITIASPLSSPLKINWWVIN